MAIDFNRNNNKESLHKARDIIREHSKKWMDWFKQRDSKEIKLELAEADI